MSEFKTLTRLMQISLYLNRRLILWLTVIFGLLFILTANTLPQFSILYQCILFIGGALISSAAFKEVHDRSLNVHYLTLPVSAGVHYLALWLLTGPAYFIFTSLLYALGMLVHLLGGTFWSSFGDGFGFMLIAVNYMIANALFLLGGIYFKKLPLLKTLGVILLISLGTAMIKGAVFNGGWRLLFSERIFLLFWVVLGVLAWILAYRQLKRSELC